MKSAFVFTCFFLSTVAATSVGAQTYQWKDSAGRTVISDTPPPGTAKESRTLGSRSPATSETSNEDKSAAKAPDAPKTTAEKELEFKKRQQDAKEKAEKDAKTQAAAAEKRENCERARRNVAALETDQPIANLNDKGESVLMDNTQRNQEIERARRFMSGSCK